MGGYYAGREAELCRLFGAPVVIGDDHLDVGGRRFPVVDDVIVTVPAGRLPARVAARLHGGQAPEAGGANLFAADIQASFGEEWWAHGDVLREHAAEFEQYFDLVDLDRLAERSVADLGCGSGRWATFVAPRCRQLVVVDFSDAILVARENLRDHPNVVFVLGDVLDLPFGPDAFDLAYSLGVLHHLPAPALDVCRRLAPLAPELLVYLYYALDNRPAYFRVLLRPVTAVRTRLARIRGRRTRDAIALVIAAAVYGPAALLGRALAGTSVARRIPLIEFYAGMSLRRLRQDAYDRFFTSIEQRVSRAEIATLADTFGTVTVSDGLPYWHFTCYR